MATHAPTNAHFATAYRLEAKPNLSSQFNHMASANFELTKERDLSRYRTGYSDRTNIYDNARTVSPTNFFGIRHIKDWDRVQHFAPSGIYGVNSTVQSGAAFTKPFVRNFNII